MHKYLILLFLLFPMVSFSEEDTIIETDIESTASDEIKTEETIEYKTKNAKIQILNKITAKSHYVEVPVNSQITFGTIKIKIFNCITSSDYELPENKILLNIYEKKIGEDKYSSIFNGWMFSSSPSINSLEHPLYDVTAISCFD